MPKYGKMKSYIGNVSEKNDTTAKCDACEFQTNSPSAFKLHVKFVHKKIIPAMKDSNTNHKCFVCYKIFETRKDVRKHLREHKPSKA